MKRLRRILVAIKDPAARSLPAVDKALQLAKGAGARVELFHAIATHVYTDFELTNERLDELKQSRLEKNRALLQAVAARVSAATRFPRASIKTAVEWDYPAHEAIVRRAEQIGADLIVCETHAGPHQAPWLLRLTDWELIRHSSVPVLVVKSRRPYRNPLLLAAVDPTHAYAKPSKLDDRILEAAATVKQALRGSLHAVHAFVPLPTDVKPSELLDEKAIQRLEQRARAAARARLDATLKKAPIARGGRHVIGKHPVNAIPEVARKLKSDIVVMGAISRSGIRRVFIGNTAERILDDLECDVLVVKPEGFQSDVKRSGRGVRLVTTPVALP